MAISIPKIIWPDNAADAVIIQNELRHKVSLRNDFPEIKTIAGVDCSFGDEGRVSKAFIVLMKFPELEVITSTHAELPTTFPYIPGFLSFREIPVILEAIKQLPQMPDIFMVDGQGIAHPRRFGIASHLGVLLDYPTLGVAKSLLRGKYIEPGAQKLSQSLLMDKDERIGTVLRSKEKCKPLFISPGHCISHESAVDLTIKCLTRYRLPEPTRIADKISKAQKTKQLEFI